MHVMHLQLFSETDDVAGISASNQSSFTLCSTNTSSCFPAAAMVTTPTGQLPMHRLQLGDQVGPPLTLA